MAGPLICLWADLTSKDVQVKPQEIILFVQRVLVLLGSASHSERRKVTWSRVNPSIVDLLPEDGEEEKESTLLGGGFLERASKRMEDEKTLAKVTESKPPPQKRRHTQDPNDLTSFFGQRRPCQVRQQEPSVPAAVLQPVAAELKSVRRFQRTTRAESSRTNNSRQYCMYKHCNNFQQHFYLYFAVAMPPPYGPPPTMQ